ncbi:MAG: thioredoxin family protein [Bacteroidota bacterium]
MSEEKTVQNTDQKKKTFQDLVQDSEVPVLVDVYSDTCGPCISLKPVLKELKTKMGEDLRIIKINGPRNVSFMHTYQIRAFPTLMVFHKGEIVWTREGWINARMLEKMIKSHTKD